MLKFFQILYVFSFFCFFPIELEALYLDSYISVKLPRYKLIDLGPTMLDEEALTRKSWPISLGPKINNKSQVIGNRGGNSFLWHECKGFLHFEKDGGVTNFVDISNTGSILGRIYSRSGAKWFIWSESQCQRENFPVFIDVKCLKSHSIFFRAINNSGHLVGVHYTDNHCRSIFFDYKKNLKEISSGILLDINDNNTMVGIESCYSKKPPFLWHIAGGMGVIGDDLRLGKPSGILHYGYPVIAYDNTVYGTFQGRKQGVPYTFAYYWNCEDHTFQTFDLMNMEISAVNRCHTLVGSLFGQAAMSVNHRSPRTLVTLLKGDYRGWELIEATDINDIGQIVGYGTFNGNLHLFLLNPIHEETKKNLGHHYTKRKIFIP